MSSGIYIDRGIEIKILLSTIKVHTDLKYVNLYNSLSFQFNRNGYLTDKQLELLRSVAYNQIDYTPKEQAILNKLPIYCQYGN